MSDWKPFTPTWTYKEHWWVRLMFWRKKRKPPVAIYRQVGKKVHIRIGKDSHGANPKT